MSDHIYEAWAEGSSALSKYTGSTDQYSVANVSNERHGPYALEGDGAYGRIDYPDGDGPQRGETFACAAFVPESEEQAARISLLFAVQPEAVSGSYDAYVIVADHAQGRLRLGVREEGSYRWPAAGESDFDPSGTSGQWNELHVDFGYSNESDIRVEYRTAGDSRLADVILEETTFDSGGWGYSLWTTSGAEPSARADYLRDTTPEGEPSGDAPAPPQNLSMTGRTASSISIGWDHSPDYDGDSA